MKLRKLFAGLAAAATLLGGMALGAATAQAAGEDTTGGVSTAVTNPLDGASTTITLQASDDLAQFHLSGDTSKNYRDFEYVLLGEYKNNGDGKIYLETPQNIEENIKNAFEQVTFKDANGTDTNLKAEFAKSGLSDPMAWLGQQVLSDTGTPEAGQIKITAAMQQQLAEALKSLATNQISQDVNNTDQTKGWVPNTDAKTITHDFGTPGLYLIVDKSSPQTGTYNNCQRTWSGIAPLLVGTYLDKSVVANAEGSVLVQLGTGNANPKQDFNDQCKTKPYFQKIGSLENDKNGLIGAKFTIKGILGDSEYGNITDSTSFDNKWNEERTWDVNMTKETPANGKFDFGDLADGTYLIQETTTPNGYLSKYAAKLVLRVWSEKDDKANTTKVKFELKEVDGFDLLQKGGDGSASKPYQYKNITSDSELPHTGAAGTAMFVVLALLLGGAAVAVSLKSRSTKRVLRG